MISTAMRVNGNGHMLRVGVRPVHQKASNEGTPRATPSRERTTTTWHRSDVRPHRDVAFERQTLGGEIGQGGMSVKVGTACNCVVGQADAVVRRGLAQFRKPARAMHAEARRSPVCHSSFRQDETVITIPAGRSEGGW